MKIAIGSDHAGYEMKSEIMDMLKSMGIGYENFGADGPESVDYPEYGEKVAISVIRGEADFGIVICGTGIGISIAANKVPGIRAALCSDCFSARMSRLHNNANVLAMGGRVIGAGLAMEIARVFLETEFEGGRHQRRLDKISLIEEKSLSRDISQS